MRPLRGSFQSLGFRSHIYRRFGLADCQNEIEAHILSHLQPHTVLRQGEARRLNFDFVFTGNQIRDFKLTGCPADRRAHRAGFDTAGLNSRAADRMKIGIHDKPIQRSEIALRKQECTQKREKQQARKSPHNWSSLANFRSIVLNRRVEEG
jgi:hypothetical protein